MRHSMDVAKFNTNTARLYAWAERNGAEVTALNNAIQLRVIKGRQTYDFYPSTGKIMGSRRFASLPDSKKGLGTVMRALFDVEVVKPKAAQCHCNHHYIYDGGMACLHKMYSTGIVAALTRQTRPGTVDFYLWHDWNAKYRDGSRNKLNDVSEIQLAIELAKQYDVPLIRL